MTGTGRRQAQTEKRISYVERSYPGADANTAKLVNKLRHRGVTDPRAAQRMTSSALIEDAYRVMPERQQSKSFDNNYSPYSNVNAEAMREERERRAEARRNAAMRAQQKAPRPANRSGAAIAARRESHVPERRRPENGQLLESGPREVAVRRVPVPKFAFLIIFVSVVLFFMVQSIVSNFEQKREIEKLQNTVDALEQKRDELLSELEDRDDLAYVEDRAEELGMIKDNQTGGKYIDLSEGDFIENYGGGDEAGGALTTMLSAIGRRLSHLFGGN